MKSLPTYRKFVESQKRKADGVLSLREGESKKDSLRYRKSDEETGRTRMDSLESLITTPVSSPRGFRGRTSSFRKATPSAYQKASATVSQEKEKESALTPLPPSAASSRSRASAETISIAFGQREALSDGPSEGAGSRAGGREEGRTGERRKSIAKTGPPQPANRGKRMSVLFFGDPFSIEEKGNGEGSNSERRSDSVSGGNVASPLVLARPDVDGGKKEMANLRRGSTAVGASPRERRVSFISPTLTVARTRGSFISPSSAIAEAEIASETAKTEAFESKATSTTNTESGREVPRSPFQGRARGLSLSRPPAAKGREEQGLLDLASVGDSKGKDAKKHSAKRVGFSLKSGLEGPRGSGAEQETSLKEAESGIVLPSTERLSTLSSSSSAEVKALRLHLRLRSILDSYNASWHDIEDVLQLLNENWRFAQESPLSFLIRPRSD